MKPNQFDNIAPVYDLIASAFSFGNVRKSREYFLNQLPEADNCLIVAGGSGDVILPLLKAGLAKKVTFLEPSVPMLEKAKNKVQKAFPERLKDVTFINLSCSSLPADSRFDLIFTNYFFDLFEEEEADYLIGLLKSHLTDNGSFICTDFYNKNFSFYKTQFFRLILFSLYRFFNLVSSVSANYLVDIPGLMEKAGLKSYKTKFFYLGLIRTDIWKK